MQTTKLLWCLNLLALAQGQDPGWFQTLLGMLDAGLEIGVLLLSFTLAIFVVLVFGVRVVLVVRKLPVPVDPLDMAKPKGFRALMLGAAAVLAPLVALDFLPVGGLDRRWVLVVAYAFEFFLAAALWLFLHLFYEVRARRAQSKT
jgi:hypothetical protein